jgi:hypothetical protein
MANDQDIIDIKDKVEEIKNDIGEIKSDVDSVVTDKGVKVQDGVQVKINGQSFSNLGAIQKIENNLEKITGTTDNTHLISTSLTNGGSLYNLIDEIKNAVVGSRSNISSPQNNSNTGGTGVSITNAQPQNSSLGGFSDIFDKIYDELKKLHTSVINQELRLSPEDLKNFKEGELEGYYKQIQDAKDAVQKQKEEEEHKKKSSTDYYKQQKKKRREEEQAERRSKIPEGLRKTASGITSAILSNPTTNNVVGALAGGVSTFAPWAGTAINGIKALFDLFAKQDKEASDYARAIGGSKRGKQQILNVAQNVVQQAKPGYGINQEDVIKAARETAEAIGRSVSNFSTESLMSSVLLKKMGIQGDAISNFDTFGKSISETDRFMTDLYKQVSKRGLSFKNVAKSVNDNLKAAQKYNFQNGLKGLERMAERSTQLKFNIQQAMTFAEKVSTFEGAIKTAADLSVLGGSFSMYSNPMQMMYEGLNDIEALQDRMIKMYGNKAQWNNEKGEFEINPVTKDIMKQAATAMGVDPGEMISLAMNQAKFNRTESQIANKNQFDKDTIEYIKNLSEIDKNGYASITLNGTQKAVSSLTSADAAQIRNEAKAKEDKDAATMGDIYVHTKGIQETLDDMLKYLQTQLGRWVAKIAGVKFDGDASKGYWKNLSSDEKSELKKKYGSKWQAKMAVGMGEETENVNEKLGRGLYEGETVREFLNQYRGSHPEQSISKKEVYAKWKDGNLDDEYKYWLKHRHDNVETKASGIVQGNYHINGGVPAIYDGKPVEIEKDETLFGKDVLYRYGSDFLKNIKDHNVPTITSLGNNPIVISPNANPRNTVVRNSFNPNISLTGGFQPNVRGAEMPFSYNPITVAAPKLQNVSEVGPTLSNVKENTLNPISVTPTVNSAQQYQGPEKISFDTFKVEIGGKIDLTSGNQTKPLDISKLSQTDLDKLTQMIYKQVYNEISRRIEKGYNKETNPFRGA